MQRRRRRRGGLSAAEQQELWQRWRHGESLSAIARALDRRATVVRRVVAGTGGFAPVARRRSPRVLALAEREEISRAMGAAPAIGPRARTRPPGSGHAAPSAANSPLFPDCGAW